MRDAGGLGILGAAVFLLVGCGGGPGNLAYGPTGNGPPPDNQQQSSVATSSTGLCQPFCQLDVTCPNSSTTDVATCTSACVVALAQATCRNETISLVTCVNRLNTCDVNALAAACGSQATALANCENTASNACSAGQCDSCTDPCQACQCQHPTDPTQCADACGVATPNGG